MGAEKLLEIGRVPFLMMVWVCRARVTVRHSGRRDNEHTTRSQHAPHFIQEHIYITHMLNSLK
jgi:hypothetical protein